MASTPPTLPPGAAQQRLVLFAAVTRGRSECASPHAVAATQMQDALGGGFGVVVAHVPDVNAALNELHAGGVDGRRYEAAIVVESMIECPPALAAAALRSGLPFVVGVYPVNDRLDYDAIARHAEDRTKTEPLAFCANEYNVDVPASSVSDFERPYIAVDSAELGVAVVSRAVCEAVAAKFPDLRAGGEGATWGFAAPGELEDGTGRTRHADGHALFCDAWRRCGGVVWADLERPCTRFAPLHFTGCAGERLMAMGAIR